MRGGGGGRGTEGEGQRVGLKKCLDLPDLLSPAHKRKPRCNAPWYCSIALRHGGNACLTPHLRLPLLSVLTSVSLPLPPPPGPH